MVHKYVDDTTLSELVVKGHCSKINDCLSKFYHSLVRIL